VSYINWLLSREVHWIIRYKFSECDEIEFTDTAQEERRNIVKGVAHIILESMDKFEVASV